MKSLLMLIKVKPRISKRLLLLFVMSLGSILYLRENAKYRGEFFKIRFITDSEVPGYLVYTEGCRIPYMDPFDDSIKKYFHRKNHYSCSKKIPLVESNQTSIYIVPEALRFYHAKQMDQLACCYTAFWRKKVKGGIVDYDADNKYEFSNECTQFIESAKIYHEYIRVICKMNDVEVYKDFHAFIVPKEINSKSIIKPKLQGPSVLIIGADSVSRLNFYRQMPKTVQILTDLKAIEFVGYNKVADNTFPNLLPVLSGHTMEEIQTFCWSSYSDVFDKCPWIWKNFSDAGSYTGFGEDSSSFAVFNFLKKGFSQPPVDYYLRPFMKLNEDEIGHSKNMYDKYCVGDRFANQVLLEYAYKFCSNMTLSNKKFWGLYWGTSLTHHVFNVIPNADDIYFSFLDKLRDSGVLNHTVVFFMSDHGVRIGKIRGTFQGRMEDRLPFLYLLLPEWFRKEYNVAVMNALNNRHMLTSPFDVHETMKDLLDLNNIKPEVLEKRARELDAKRGISLFLPVPKNRTCENAGITEEWCTCRQTKSISVTDKIVERAAHTTVQHINDILLQYTQCAHLSLKGIQSARYEAVGNVIKSNSKYQITDYIINIITEPGEAEFEATVRHRSKSDSVDVQGFISRINTYGSQSKCVHDFQLRLYCYCLSGIESVKN